MAAEAAAAFPDGVRVVPLAAVGDPALVLPTVAQALGVGEGKRPLPDRLARSLGTRRLLLVLDNLEHLLAAAPDVRALLALCQTLKILATSRAALGPPGEHVVPVPPLALPAPDQPVSAARAERYAALRLFLERARAARPGFAPTDADVAAIANICRRLDGLPLAIELAAARVKLLPTADLLKRLERRLPLLTGGSSDAPARLRTLRDAIAWSYDLLAPAEQALFRGLAVFEGGFALEAAASVEAGREAMSGHPFAADGSLLPPYGLGWASPPPEILDPTFTPAPVAVDGPFLERLEALVDQNLVRRMDPSPGDPPGVPRFAMLETIREYGLERLAEAGEEPDTRRAHAAFMLAFVEIAGQGLWGPAHRGWLERLQTDLGNLRAALDWAATQGAAEAETGLRLAEQLWLFWQTRGLVSEGRIRLATALAQGDTPPWVRGAALGVAGMLAWVQHDDDRAEELNEESLANFRELGHPAYIARQLFFLALVAWHRGDVPRMAALAEEALEIYRQLVAWTGLGRTGMGVCLITLAIVARGPGEAARATAMLDEAHELCRADGFGWGIATSRLYAAEVARDAGDLDRATALIAEAMDLYREQGDPWGTGAAIAGMATLATARGEAARAARLFGAADGLFDRVGAFLPTSDPAAFEQSVAQARTTLGEGQFTRAFASGRALSPDEAVAEARRVGRAGGGRRAGANAPRPDEAAIELAAGVELTERECDVLPLLAQGRSNQEIADALYVSLRTVEAPIRQILAKLGLSRRELVAAYAARSAAPKPPSPPEPPTTA